MARAKKTTMTSSQTQTDRWACWDALLGHVRVRIARGAAVVAPGLLRSVDLAIRVHDARDQPDQADDQCDRRPAQPDLALGGVDLGDLVPHLVIGEGPTTGRVGSCHGPPRSPRADVVPRGDLVVVGHLVGHTRRPVVVGHLVGRPRRPVVVGHLVGRRHARPPGSEGSYEEPLTRSASEGGAPPGEESGAAIAGQATGWLRRSRAARSLPRPRGRVIQAAGEGAAGGSSSAVAGRRAVLFQLVRLSSIRNSARPQQAMKVK